MLNEPLICYLLDQPPLLHSKKQENIKVKIVDPMRGEEDMKKPKGSAQDSDAEGPILKFKSWGIYRSENCLPNWRKCEYL